MTATVVRRRLGAVPVGVGAPASRGRVSTRRRAVDGVVVRSNLDRAHRGPARPRAERLAVTGTAVMARRVGAAALRSRPDPERALHAPGRESPLAAVGMDVHARRLLAGRLQRAAGPAPVAAVMGGVRTGTNAPPVRRHG